MCDPPPHRAEQVTLTVNVINLNDNPPRFMPSEPRPQVYVTEEQPAPVTVYTFNVCTQSVGMASHMTNIYVIT